MREQALAELEWQIEGALVPAPAKGLLQGARILRVEVARGRVDLKDPASGTAAMTELCLLDSCVSGGRLRSLRVRTLLPAVAAASSGCRSDPSHPLRIRKGGSEQEARSDEWELMRSEGEEGDSRVASRLPSRTTEPSKSIEKRLQRQMFPGRKPEWEHSAQESRSPRVLRRVPLRSESSS